MSDLLKRWMEISFVCAVIYLVLSRGYIFSQIVRAFGDVYSQSMGALMARN